MKDGIKQIVGKTIRGVVVAERPSDSRRQVFLVFSDDTHFELWGDSFTGAGGVDPGGLEEVRSYCANMKSQVTLEVSPSTHALSGEMPEPAKTKATFRPIGRKMLGEIVFTSAIVAGVIYVYFSDRPSPPPYVNGPNAVSAECRKLSQEWLPMIERQSDEDKRADDYYLAEFERLERSPMTGAQRQIAENNLSATEDEAKAAREARQENEFVRLREQERESGCLPPNPQPREQH
jgi:hypothetical protein